MKAMDQWGFISFILERRFANVKEAILLLAAIMMLTALLIDLFVFTSVKK